jgi:hypothetical protein
MAWGKEKGEITQEEILKLRNKARLLDENGTFGKKLYKGKGESYENAYLGMPNTTDKKGESMDEHEELKHEHGHTDPKVEWMKRETQYRDFLNAFGDEEEIVRGDANIPEQLAQALEVATNVNVNEILIDCIDEGIPRVDSSTTGSKLQIGIGGAGVLLNPESLTHFADYFAEQVKSGKKLVIRSHQGCGAAKLASGETDPQQVDKVAQTFGQTLARLVSEKTGQTIAHEFVTAEMMTRPEDLHNAYGISIDTTGNVNYAHAKTESSMDAVPPMFNVSAVYEDSAHVMANVGVARNIAFGDHGFGKEFTAENKLIILVTRNSQDPESIRRYSELRPQVEKFMEELGDRGVLKVIDINKPIAQAA